MVAEAAAFSPEEADAPARYRQLCRLMPLLHRAADIPVWGEEENAAGLGNGHVWLETGYTARIPPGETFRLWQRLSAAADAVYLTRLTHGIWVTFTVFGSYRG